LNVRYALTHTSNGGVSTMSVQRETVGTTTVDCPNHDECDGQITLTVVRLLQVLRTGRDFTTVHGDNVSSSCGCVLDDDQQEDVVEAAQRQLRVVRG
jgi:hypothetical protein